MDLKSKGTKAQLYLFVLLISLFSSCTTTKYFSENRLVPEKVKRIGDLDPRLRETSGLELLNDSLISFNDSGGEPAIYIFHPEYPENLRTVNLKPADNIDWEDIATDSLWLYIGDFGNNSGQRDTLIIYRIFLQDIVSGKNDLTPEQISFNYQEKKPEHKTFRNPFDCESMFVYRDTIWIFTKNWTDRSSWVYHMPAEPGHYSLSVYQKLNPDILITAADFYPDKSILFLSGYRNFRPFLVNYYKSGMSYSLNSVTRFRLKRGLQTEGIVYDPHSETLYISHEKSSRKQGLYKIKLDLN